MIRLLFLALISIGLVACGNDEASTNEDMAAETSGQHVDAISDDAMSDDAMSDDVMSDDTMNDDVPMNEPTNEPTNKPTDKPMENAMDSFESMQATYLADYAAQEGTVATGSGLLYQVVREGEGESPSPADIVEVHYEGRLVDGTVFDSSYERDETIEFPLNRVIAGWTEGLQHMQPGAEYIFVIPPELGYGSDAQGEIIPADAVLIFRVELFNVTPAQ